MSYLENLLAEFLSWFYKPKVKGRFVNTTSIPFGTKTTKIVDKTLSYCKLLFVSIEGNLKNSDITTVKYRKHDSNTWNQKQIYGCGHARFSTTIEKLEITPAYGDTRYGRCLVTYEGSYWSGGYIGIAGLPQNIIDWVGMANIETLGKDNILIDLLKKGAYIDRREVIENQGATAFGDWGQNIWGKFFSRGCIGHLRRILATVTNTSGSDADIVLGLAIHPNGGEIDTVTIKAVAGDDRTERWGTLDRWWSYDKLFVYVKSGLSADVKIAYDKVEEPDQYKLVGGKWAYTYADNCRLWIKLDYAGLAYAITVGGTVNVTEMPNSSSLSDSLAQTIEGGETEDVFSVVGCGKISRFMVWVTREAGDLLDSKVEVMLEIDGVGSWITIALLKEQVFDVENTFSPISFSKIDDTASAQRWHWSYNFPLSFKRSFKFRVKNTSAPEIVAGARALYFTELIT